MDQNRLDQILVEADKSNGVLYKLRKGTFNTQDLDELTQICNYIQQVVETTQLIEKKWVNRVRNLPLELEMLWENSTKVPATDASKAAVNLITDVAVFYSFPWKPVEESPTSLQAEAIGASLASDDCYLFGVRMNREVDPEKAHALINLLYELKDIASNHLIDRDVLAQIVQIPYVLYWNRHYFTDEDLERHDQFTKEINAALDYVLA